MNQKDIINFNSESPVLPQPELGFDTAMMLAHDMPTELGRSVTCYNPDDLIKALPKDANQSLRLRVEKSRAYGALQAFFGGSNRPKKCHVVMRREVNTEEGKRLESVSEAVSAFQAEVANSEYYLWGTDVTEPQTVLDCKEYNKGRINMFLGRTYNRSDESKVALNWEGEKRSGLIYCRTVANDKIPKPLPSDDATDEEKKKEIYKYAPEPEFNLSNENFVDFALMGDVLSAPPGTRNYAHRRLLGSAVAREVPSDTFEKLSARNVNVFCKIKKKPMTFDGRSSTGEWLNSIMGEDWFDMRLFQVISDLMATDGFSFTTSGMNKLKASVNRVIGEGMQNGYISQEDPTLIRFLDPRSDVLRDARNARELKYVEIGYIKADPINKITVSKTTDIQEIINNA